MVTFLSFQASTSVVCYSGVVYHQNPQWLLIWCYCFYSFCYCSLFTFQRGFVHPLQDVAHPSVSSFVLCLLLPVPGGSFLPCYVVLPSSTWWSPWSLSSPWLSPCAVFGPPIVLHSCYMSGPSPLLFQCVFCKVSYVLFLISEHGILFFSFSLTFSSPFALWAVLSLFVNCLLRDHFGYPKVIVGKTYWSITCFFEWYGELSILEYFLFFFLKQLHAALILADISSFVVSLRGVVCLRYLNSVTFSIFFLMISVSSLSAWFVIYFVLPFCIFRPTLRLSEYRLFKCFSVCFVFPWK